MWIKLSQNTSCTNEKLWLGDLETDLETELKTWQSDCKRGHTVFKFLWGWVVRGLKGSFIPWKIWHWWPRIWNKRRICNQKGKAALPCPCMNREACCLQLGQLTSANWNHPLASGFTRERRLLHPTTTLRHSTNKLLTELKTFSSSQLQNLQRPFHQQSD